MGKRILFDFLLAFNRSSLTKSTTDGVEGSNMFFPFARKVVNLIPLGMKRKEPFY
jgi:hypothetical protein